MKPRARAFANPAPTNNRPGAGYVPAPKLEEWAKASVPNAVRGLLTLPHREIVRSLAALPDSVKRSQMLAEIQRQAGREQADRLRNATVAWLQGVKVPA
jgi:hypothetical protein